MWNLILSGTVLVIGDSHSVGPFGWSLDQNLRDKGLNVATYASCGSIGQWWMNGHPTTCGYYSRDLKGEVTQTTTHPTPQLEQLLSEIKPESVIVELASNYVNTPSDAFVLKDLRSLVSMIRNSGAQCFFISAPDMRRFRLELPRLRRLLKEAIGDECRLFDSEKVTSYPETGGDGIHYWFGAGKPIAQKWANEVVKDFMKDSND